MRKAGVIIAAGAALFAGPSLASSTGPNSHTVLPAAGKKTPDGIQSVKPGDAINVACAAAAYNPRADVRVVLTIASVNGESKTGYKRLMATDKKVVKDRVRFRVPETAGLENHTVHLKVYVVDEKGAQSCDAGLIRIV